MLVHRRSPVVEGYDEHVYFLASRPQSFQCKDSYNELVTESRLAEAVNNDYCCLRCIALVLCQDASCQS